VRTSRTWDGQEALASEIAELSFHASDGALEIRVEAPYHGDPAPEGEPGSTPRLWEYEVVEVFLLGAGGCYLELEFGPHGHYLALSFRGMRCPCRSGLPLSYQALRHGDRWSGRAKIVPALLPAGLDRANGYAIHGAGSTRRYLASTPVPGPAPDFHRLELFEPWRLPEGVSAEGEVYERSECSSAGCRVRPR